MQPVEINLTSKLKKKKMERKYSLKCYYTNVDTLSNKKHELDTLIDVHKPDVLIITETLPKHCDVKPTETEYHVRNYNLHTNFNSNTCRRGVCIYVKENLKSTKVYEQEASFTESVWCEIKLENNDTLLLGGIYRSPNSNHEVTHALINFFKQLKFPTHVLIGGDFNFPEINWHHLHSTKPDDHVATVFLEAIQDCFLFQNVQHPTHYRANQDPTLIDLLFTNEEDMIYGISHLPPLGLSHHSGLLFDYRCYSEPSINAVDKVAYKYYAGNYNEMKLFLEDLNLCDQIKDKNAKDAWDTIDRALKEATDKFVPKYRIHNSTPPPPPWMNDRVREKSRLKREAFNQLIANRNEKKRSHYAKMRNQCKWETRKAVRQYEKGVAKDTKRNPKAFFKYVQSKTKARAGIPDLNYNGATASSDSEKAEALNQFYSSVFTQEDKVNVPVPAHNFHGPKLTEIEITEDMVRGKLTDLNVNKSPGGNGHHPRILHEMKELLIKPLTHLFSARRLST